MIPDNKKLATPAEKGRARSNAWKLKLYTFRLEMRHTLLIARRINGWDLPRDCPSPRVFTLRSNASFKGLVLAQADDTGQMLEPLVFAP